MVAPFRNVLFLPHEGTMKWCLVPTYLSMWVPYQIKTLKPSTVLSSLVQCVPNAYGQKNLWKVLCFTYFMYFQMILFVPCAADMLLDDFVVAENSPFHSDANNPGITSERGSNMPTPKTSNLCPFDPIPHDEGPESPLPADLRWRLFPLLVLQPTLYVVEVAKWARSRTVWDRRSRPVYGFPPKTRPGPAQDRLWGRSDFLFKFYLWICF